MVISWEETKMSCGIYKIENKVTHEIYIGCSSNIEERIKSHKQRYNNYNSREYNSKLYRAIRLHGIDLFSFSILEYCTKSELPDKEKKWISFYDSTEYGYNETRGGYGYTIISEKHHNALLTKEDVVEIRTRYNNLERKNVVYQDYTDKIGKSGFDKVWKGDTWPNVLTEVYTKENIEFHKHDTANKGEANGKSKLTEEDVYNIRKMKKEGVSIYEAYTSYGHMTFKSFQNIWYGCNWKHIIV